MDVQGKASSVPKYTTYEEFDVFGGKSEGSKAEYMQASFHTSDMVDGDSRFMAKAELMGATGGALIGQKSVLQTPVEDKEVAATKAQATQAAV